MRSKAKGMHAVVEGPIYQRKRDSGNSAIFIYTVVFSVLAGLKLEDRCTPGGKSAAMWCGHKMHKGQFILCKMENYL